MSPRATGSAAEETQYRFGFIFTRRIDLFGLFFFFLPLLTLQRNNGRRPGENVSAPRRWAAVPRFESGFSSPLASCIPTTVGLLTALRSSILLSYFFMFIFCIAGSRAQKVGTMPDSPADVKTQSTPPTMPPPPPAVSQSTNRSASFTPTTSKSSKSLVS